LAIIEPFSEVKEGEDLKTAAGWRKSDMAG
jgi:hypothetical protein